MEAQCVNCIYDHQTIHTIKLSDHQFEMLKWAVDSEKNLYNSILKTCSPKDIDNGGYIFVVILKWLDNLDNVLKNS